MSSQVDAIEALRLFVIETRQTNAWSQEQVAKRGGIPRGTLASIEAGRGSMPKQDTLQKLSKGLNVPYTILDRITRGEPPEPSIGVRELAFVLSEQGTEFIEVFVRIALLPKTEQRFALKMLTVILDGLQDKD